MEIDTDQLKDALGLNGLNVNVEIHGTALKEIGGSECCEAPLTSDGDGWICNACGHSCKRITVGTEEVSF